MSSPSTPRMLSHGCRRTLVMILGTGGAPLPLRPAPRGRHRSWSLTASTRSTARTAIDIRRRVQQHTLGHHYRRCEPRTAYDGCHSGATNDSPPVRSSGCSPHRRWRPERNTRPPSMQRRQNEPLHTWEVFVSHAQVALILGAGDITARRGPPAGGSCDRAVRLGGRRHPSPPRRSGLSRTSGFTVRQIRT